MVNTHNSVFLRRALYTVVLLVLRIQYGESIDNIYHTTPFPIQQLEEVYFSENFAVLTIWLSDCSGFELTAAARLWRETAP